MIEIISIGTELLTGQTINTNASTIAKILLRKGYEVEQITTIPDKGAILEETIIASMKRASFIILTGGLGPTTDDITRATLAKIFDKKLRQDNELAANLERQYGNACESLTNQATIIEGVEIMPNKIGTASGFILEKGTVKVFALPGVPIEMQEMLEKSVIPSLAQVTSPEYFQRTLFLFLILENRVDPHLRQLEKKYPHVEFGLCPSHGTLSIYLKLKAQTSKEAEEKFKPILQELRTRYKKNIFSEKDNTIESAIHKQFISRKLTLACAESCTGGLMSSRLTQISGSSNYFLVGLVTYSNQMKTTILNVNPRTLEKHGAVSCETVVEMVKGTLALSKADYAISISGIAGPTGGSKEKPIGTIWGAIGKKDSTIFTKQLTLKRKKRSTIIDYSTTYLLSHLWRYIQFDIPPFEES